jgi:hypothetical protein
MKRDSSVTVAKTNGIIQQKPSIVAHLTEMVMILWTLAVDEGVYKKNINE